MTWKKKKKKWKPLTVHDFSKNFPGSFPAPDELLSLLEYQARHEENDRKYCYSGGFYLYNQAVYSIHIHSDIDKYFIPFGKDGDGSTYAFWIYDEKISLNWPIVFLGIDWSKNILLANTIREFLQLLSLGVESLGYAIHDSSKWPNLISNDEKAIDFREWLKQDLEISVPQNPNRILEDAQRIHPNLGEWIESKIGIPPN